MAKVPARYIGGYEVLLGPSGGPYVDGNGTRLSSLVLRHGDTLMIEEQELRGISYKFDPRGVNDPLQVGYGHVVLPEDEGKSDEELQALGYQFHRGRADFEEIAPQMHGDGQQAPAASGQPAEPVTSGVPGNQPRASDGAGSGSEEVR